MGEYFAIRWMNGMVRMLDQRLLPQQEIYRDYTDFREVALAIKDMVIRGAPAIGVAAGFGMALAATTNAADNTAKLKRSLKQAAQTLYDARPTAVNLGWAIARVLGIVSSYEGNNCKELQELVVYTALKIAEEDVQINRKIGEIGNSIVPVNANIIHHCNTGALATADYGTALGVIRCAHENGKKVHVYVDETRPRLQGARLTSWELTQLQIPHTLIVDGASGHIMRTNKIDLCLVGCDRIAANGDVANKIGTYNLALAAFAHQVPFYSVGPISTFDMQTVTGDDIQIEQRGGEEVTRIGDCVIAPEGVRVSNPAFDITPAKYITGIITEYGIAMPPYRDSLVKIFNKVIDNT